MPPRTAARASLDSPDGRGLHTAPAGQRRAVTQRQRTQRPAGRQRSNRNGTISIKFTKHRGVPVKNPTPQSLFVHNTTSIRLLQHRDLPVKPLSLVTAFGVHSRQLLPLARRKRQPRSRGGDVPETHTWSAPHSPSPTDTRQRRTAPTACTSGRDSPAWPTCRRSTSTWSSPCTHGHGGRHTHGLSDTICRTLSGHTKRPQLHSTQDIGRSAVTQTASETQHIRHWS